MKPVIPEGSSRIREMVVLLRLVETGECLASGAAQDIIDRLHAARWIVPSARGRRWELVVDQRANLEARLGAIWPDWALDAAFLRSLRLDPMLAVSVEALPALRRSRAARAFMHRKTWNAASAAGSKRKSRMASEALLTDDWSVRGRVSCECQLQTDTRVVDLQRETRERSEFAIAQREWLRSGRFERDLPHLVLTVENVGAFVDLHLPDKTMLLFSQGSATLGAAELVRALPNSRWLHFGDLDPAGVQACERIARLSGRSPAIFVPAFAAEYLDASQSTSARWSAMHASQPVLEWLAEHRRWLEQEVFLLDPRLDSELEGLASRATASFISAR